MHTLIFKTVLKQLFSELHLLLVLGHLPIQFIISPCLIWVHLKFIVVASKAAKIYQLNIPINYCLQAFTAVSLMRTYMNPYSRKH